MRKFLRSSESGMFFKEHRLNFYSSILEKFGIFVRNQSSTV